MAGPGIPVTGEGCTFIASLLQKDPNRRRDQHELLTIGFIIYKLDDDKTYDFSKYVLPTYHPWIHGPSKGRLICDIVYVGPGLVGRNLISF